MPSDLESPVRLDDLIAVVDTSDAEPLDRVTTTAIRPSCRTGDSRSEGMSSI
jgi:hypothetical protein